MRRKKFLLDRGFQLTVIGYFLIVAFITAAIHYTLVQFMFSSFMKEGLSLGLPSGHAYYSFIKMQRGEFLWYSLLSTGILTVVLTLMGLFLSHRIVGPIYKMKKYMRREANSKTRHPLEFRKRDFFTDLASDFNDYTKLISGANDHSEGSEEKKTQS